MDRLRLLAVDADDLAILSAHCQDAVVLLKDCRYRPGEKQFVLEMNRFVWETAAANRTRFSIFRRPEYERRRAILHFDRVEAVSRLGLDHDRAGQVLVLLAIRFVPSEPPSGTIELVFADGAAIRLRTEVIEAQLADAGAAWSTTSRPDHERPDPQD